MAQWYDKSGDMSLVLDTRQAAWRIPGLSANAWTECRIGMFCSATAASDPNTAYSDETLNDATPYGYFMFGLKNSDDPETLPGQTGCSFWGMGSRTGYNTRIVASTGVFSTLYGGGPSDGNDYLVSEDATVTVSGANPSWGPVPNLGIASAITGATGYARFLGVRMVISNRGTATQSVQFYGLSGSAVTDTSEAALRTVLTNFSGASTGPSLAANTGAAAYDVPDAVFVRIPLLTVNLRIHNIMAMQSAP